MATENRAIDRGSVDLDLQNCAQQRLLRRVLVILAVVVATLVAGFRVSKGVPTTGSSAVRGPALELPADLSSG